MGLTNPRTLWIFAMLAVATPLAGLFLWDRVRGPRAARVAGHALIVVCCQVFAVLAAGVAANDWGAFYPSWASLFGAAGKGDRRTFHFGAVGATPEALPPGPPGPATDPPVALGRAGWTALDWSGRDEWPSRGAIVDAELGGGPTGLAERAYVYLPPSYFASGARRMPVVEVFTGYPGTPKNLYAQLHYPDEMLAAIRAGEAQPMVLVMTRPSATFPLGHRVHGRPARASGPHVPHR